MGILLDGKKIANEIQSEVAKRVGELINNNKRAPHLAIILIGEDGASHSYVNGKMKACKAVGFEYTLLQFATTITEKKLFKHIEQLNQDDDIDGFIVQLPLPKHISVEHITALIDSKKDVDGFTNHNFGSIVSDQPLLLPATPFGVMELLKRYQVTTKGKHCVIVGASRIVGAPMSLMMVEQGQATVTLCHKSTQDLAKHTRNADILIIAVGKPGLITADMVKSGAVIIDVGTTRITDATKKSGFRLSGDVEFEKVEPLSSFITPVPGGVGPLTIASLLLNTLKAYERHHA